MPVEKKYDEKSNVLSLRFFGELTAEDLVGQAVSADPEIKIRPGRGMV